MNLIPTEFFVTSGSAISKVSDLNAFDQALLSAGISEQNLVAVSSVIPKKAGCVERTELPMGAVTHCVLAQMRGTEGETVSAGIVYAFRKDGNGGYIAEGHIHGSRECLRKDLEWKMKEMARIRKTELDDFTYVVEELKIPRDNYGCCIAALVFTDYKT